MFRITEQCGLRTAYVTPKQILTYLKSLPADHGFRMDHADKCLFGQYLQFKAKSKNVEVFVTYGLMQRDNGRYTNFYMPQWTQDFQSSLNNSHTIITAKQLIPMISELIKDKSKAERV